MGLDASVHCDCFERGLLRSAHRPEWNVHVDQYGGRGAETGSLEADMDFDEWSLFACEHERGVLLHQYLGNINGIAIVRQALSSEPERFPLLLKRVVYSGVHSCDMLRPELFAALASELERVARMSIADAKIMDRVARFQSQLSDLLEIAETVGKPIVF